MSIISQSGALGASIMMFATNQAVPIGFAKWAHVGNQADVDVLEVMEYYRDDPDTKAIAMYMEGINNARQFLEVAQSICQEKPVIILKVGRSEVGQGRQLHTLVPWLVPTAFIRRLLNKLVFCG